MKKIPRHLGIILDGNRRWAKEKGKAVWKGHKKGVEAAKRTIKWARKKGIKILTLFIFSTENWSRKKKEVDYLMKLGNSVLDDDLEKMRKEGIAVKIIGERDKLPISIRKQIIRAEKQTKKNDGMVLNLALSYGGRAEIVEAVRNLVKKKIPPQKINENVISENLWTSDVDLIIRTGNEERLSNFLLWQSAYSEFYFCKKYWPEVNEDDLDQAILEYSQRRRRFGQ